MIQNKHLEECLKDMISSGHVMEECNYVFEGSIYKIKFKFLKRLGN